MEKKGQDTYLIMIHWFSQTAWFHLVLFCSVPLRLCGSSYSTDIRNAALVAQGANTKERTSVAPSNKRYG